MVKLNDSVIADPTIDLPYKDSIVTPMHSPLHSGNASPKAVRVIAVDQNSRVSELGRLKSKSVCNSDDADNFGRSKSKSVGDIATNSNISPEPTPDATPNSSESTVASSDVTEATAEAAN